MALVALYPKKAKSLQETLDRLEEAIASMPRSTGTPEDAGRTTVLLRAAGDLDDLIIFVGKALEDETSGNDVEPTSAGDAGDLPPRISLLVDRSPPAVVIDREEIVDELCAVLARADAAIRSSPLLRAPDERPCSKRSSSASSRPPPAILSPTGTC